MTTNPLVVHPAWESRLADGQPLGAVIGGFYKNSNMRRFPRPLNGSSRQGVAIGLRDQASLEWVLRHIRPEFSNANHDVRDAQNDINRAERELPPQGTTEREQLIRARLGQGLFRDRVSRVWGGACAVTGLSVGSLLRASHIKPWRNCTNFERLNPSNGLLLAAGLDAAFDDGLISFDSDGVALLSSCVSAAALQVVGASLGQALRLKPSEECKCFLAYHRLHVFRGSMTR
jgi:hypothetical protein